MGPIATKSKSAPTYRGLRITITVIALVAILLRITFPTLFERIDSVSVALIVVAVIPWLSPIVSKISIPGLIETELRELKKEVQEAKDDVASAAKIALRSQDVALLSKIETTGDAKQSGSSQRLIELGQEYVVIRGSMPSGPARTAAMDNHFGEMLQEARRLGKYWPGHEDALRNADAGRQLSAIAYAFAFPEASNISSLIDVVENAKQSFIQYWGLRTIQRAIDADTPYSIKDKERLIKLKNAFRSGTDRFFIISSIAQALENNR